MTTPLRIQASPPLRGGLDSVASEFPVGEDEWRVGVELTAPSRNPVIVWNASCQSEGYALDANMTSGDQTLLDSKPEPGMGASYKFAPTFIVSQGSCGIGGSQTAIGNLIRENAQDDLARAQWRGLAAVLHGAAPVHLENGDSNPSLNGFDGANTPTYPDNFNPAAPGDLKGTMQGLLDGICACSKSDLIFHVPAAFLPYFLVDGVVRWDAPSGQYHFGSHVVSFDCYPNKAENAYEAAHPTATDGTECWIWTTGPVYAAFGEIDEVLNVEWKQNKYTALVERPAILAFDPTCVRAAKARVQ